MNEYFAAVNPRAIESADDISSSNDQKPHGLGIRAKSSSADGPCRRLRRIGPIERPKALRRGGISGGYWPRMIGKASAEHMRKAIGRPVRRPKNISV